MLSGYLAHIHRLTIPAAVIAGADVRIYVNRAAEGLLDRSDRESCLEHARHVFGTGWSVSGCIHDRDFTFGPLFDEDLNVDAVLAVAAPLHELPQHLAAAKRPLMPSLEMLTELPHPLVTARPSGVVDFFNRQWFRLIGQPVRASAASNAFFAAVDARDRMAALEHWNTGIANGRSFAFELRITTTAGPRWFALHAAASRARNGRIRKWIVVLTDVEAEVVAREALARSERQHRFLADASRQINAATDLRTLVRWIAELGARAADAFAVELGVPGRRIAVSRPAGGALEGAVRSRLRSFGEHRTALPVDDRINAVGIRVMGREDYGFLAAGGAIDAATLSSEWAPVLEELAQRLSLAVERMLAREREHTIAETLQRAMLPSTLPRARGVVLDVAYMPATNEGLVGGDWYDAYDLGEERIALMIGDVAGHGIDAAIVMNQVRHLIRARSREDADPAAVLGHAGRMLHREGQAFATAFFGVLDLLTLRLRYAVAGHPPPLLVGTDAVPVEVPAHGVILGALGRPSATNYELDLRDGEALVLYTDGLTEARRDMVQGEAALRNVLSAWARFGHRAGAEELMRRLLRDTNHRDDAALLIVRPENVSPLNVSLPATAHNANRLRRAVQRFAVGSGLADDAAFEITVAVAEAVNNVVLHAYETAQEPGEVRVSLRRTSQSVVASVEDSGAWPDDAPAQPGHGLDIMRRLVPEMHVVRRAGGSKISLRKVCDPDAVLSPGR